MRLDPGEIERLAAELGQILSHMDALAEVDTTDVEPMTHAVPMRLRTRADEVEPSLPAEQATGQAPDVEGEMFQVPAIIER